MRHNGVCPSLYGALAKEEVYCHKDTPPPRLEPGASGFSWMCHSLSQPGSFHHHQYDNTDLAGGLYSCLQRTGINGL